MHRISDQTSVHSRILPALIENVKINIKNIKSTFPHIAPALQRFVLYTRSGISESLEMQSSTSRLSHRAELFRSKLIEDFQLLETMTEQGRQRAPVYNSSDVLGDYGKCTDNYTYTNSTWQGGNNIYAAALYIIILVCKLLHCTDCIIAAMQPCSYIISSLQILKC